MGLDPVWITLRADSFRSMTLLGRSIRFVLFVSAFPGFSLGLSEHGGTREGGPDIMDSLRAE
jgi:hypothetical protein